MMFVALCICLVGWSQHGCQVLYGEPEFSWRDDFKHGAEHSVNLISRVDLMEESETHAMELITQAIFWVTAMHEGGLF